MRLTIFASIYVMIIENDIPKLYNNNYSMCDTGRPGTYPDVFLYEIKKLK